MMPSPLFEKEEAHRKVRRGLVSYFELHLAGYEADDLADETLKRVWEIFSKTEDDARLVPQYAYGVAKNVLREFLRRRSRECPIDPDVEQADPRSVTPSPAVANQTRILEDGMKWLTPKDRQLLEEYHRCDAEQRRELATTLNISQSLLRVRIHFIIREVRKRLKIAGVKQ